MTTRSIVVITAGLGQPSSTRLLGQRLAAATEQALAGFGQQAEVTIVELRDHAHDLTNQLLTGFPSGRLAALTDQLIAADALIAVTPIFSVFIPRPQPSLSSLSTRRPPTPGPN